jgi:ABC-type Co2+ transport system permease subunit
MVRVLFSSDEKNPRKHYRFPQRKNTLFFDILSTGSHSPLFLHTQWFTGPLVNAVLLLCVLFVGRSEAIFLGLVPSTVALSTGILPAALAPMIPFIMISNALYVIVFSVLWKKDFFIAIGISSFLKFFFLFLVSTFLLGSFFESHILQNVVVMMSWPQLITAIIGGMIAFAVFRFVHKKQSPKN